ncbi:hypothetical protein CspHIS471_0102740 [Cutaneotrichosporon sp. HIS471]|nr:hypothetical protein CspHIS471_0102740 [Cutaneotrichosporon sp. HIS471]
MPRKSRDVKSSAPSPSPARVTRASRSRTAEDRDEVASVATQPTVPEEEEEDEEDEGDEEEVEEEEVEEEEDAEEVPAKSSREERLAKLKELRLRMNESAAANRRDLVEDHQKSKVTARELTRLEKQRKLAKTLRLKADAEANGEDLERRKAWEWSIEQNERWEKKQAASRQRGDHTFNHANDEAHRKYEKDVRTSKPDLVGYARQKEAAMGLEPGTLVPLGTTNEMAAAGPSRNAALTAADDLYRSADTLSYGDSKPSEEAVDRVVGKINKDLAGTGRKRKRQGGDGDVTYINKANKVFNSKIAKYFDKYTGDIRANLERGTAL